MKFQPIPISSVKLIKKSPFEIKSQILGMKWVFEHQDLQMFGLKLNKYE